MTDFQVWESISSALVWVNAPSIRPWAGAAAAFVAALSIEPRRWCRSLGTFVRRCVQVVIVWLAIAGLFNLVGSSSPKDGGGGGDHKTPGGAESQPVPLPRPTPKLPRDVVLVIRFIPSVADSAQARRYCCILYVRGASGVAPMKVRAGDGPEFGKRLAESLESVSVPSDVSDPKVFIEPVPFPGKSVLRRVRRRVEASLPRVQVAIGMQGNR